MPLYCLTSPPFPFRRPRNPLTLNVFPIRLTSFVIGNLPLQRVGQRALPVGQGQGQLPHFNRPAELPCIRMRRRQRSKNDRVVAPRKLICFLGKLERLCAISKCRIRIGCEYPGQVVQSGNRSRRDLQCLFVLLNRVSNFTLWKKGTGKDSASVCVLGLYG